MATEPNWESESTRHWEKTVSHSSPWGVDFLLLHWRINSRLSFSFLRLKAGPLIIQYVLTVSELETNRLTWIQLCRLKSPGFGEKRLSIFSVVEKVFWDCAALYNIAHKTARTAGCHSSWDPRVARVLCVCAVLGCFLHHFSIKEVMLAGGLTRSEPSLNSTAKLYFETKVLSWVWGWFLHFLSLWDQSEAKPGLCSKF